MIDSHRPWLGLVAFVLCAAVGLTQAAEISPESEYGRRLKFYQSVQPHGDSPFGEQFGLYTGSLSFQQADVVLDGMGPKISLVRTLASGLDDTEIANPQAFGNWTLSVPRIETLTHSG